MSRCFLREFAPEGLRECDGRIQDHHVIRQQTLKRMLTPERTHLLLDSELREAKAQLNRALKDTRNLLSACKRHHDLFHGNRERFSLGRGDLPSALEAFASEYGLVWELDRQFGLEGGSVTVNKPRLLDLFCGAGGCTKGYQRAGFYVVGVDIKPQPNYCGDEFIQADALDAPVFFDEFDAIHASPPCQAYSQAALGQRNAGKEYPDLLAPTRELLEATGLPWVLENVPGAPMRPDFRICGCQVDLKLRRVRWFETNWDGFHLGPSCHHPEPVVSVVGHGTPTWVREKLGFNPTIKDYREAMGIDWMNRNELSQAIPPAYTELIGHQLIAYLRSGEVTA